MGVASAITKRRTKAGSVVPDVDPIPVVNHCSILSGLSCFRSSDHLSSVLGFAAVAGAS